MTAYFDDLAAALARSDVADGELAEIAKAHHMHVVGPPFGAVRLARAWDGLP